MNSQKFKLMWLVSVLIMSSCSFFGVRTSAEPEYAVLLAKDNMEIRHYKEYNIASYSLNGSYQETSNRSFRPLADYIFGENQNSVKMPMTAPVFQEKHDDGWQMSFVMPFDKTFKDLPKPNNTQIALEKVPAKEVAVIRYSGLVTEDVMKDMQNQLKNWAETNGYQLVSEARSARYDPPWTLIFLRRNEIHFDIVKKQS